MAGSSGQPQPGPLLTREVRWFFDGPIPSDVISWFTAHDTRGERESRTDIYDRVEALRGVGVKRRDGDTVDSKRRLARVDDVELRPGVSGRVEDWEKTSRSDLTVGIDQVAVSKEIVTLCFYLDDNEDEASAGCEAELASVRVGSVEAWSLCFETFGDPDRRDDALALGVERLMDEKPVPTGLQLAGGVSCGYPEWISRLDPDGH